MAPLAEADGLVWNAGSQDGFPDPLPENIQWVQLKSAGIQPWITSGHVEPSRTWISAVGAYSQDVAEHAVGLLLALLRQFPHCARSNSWQKTQIWDAMRSLRGRQVAIIGCGSIGRAMIPMLDAFGAQVLAINRSGRPVTGAVQTQTSEHLNEVLTAADDMVVAGASTDQTRYLIGAEQFRALGAQGNIVNIARGDLVDPEALEQALTDKVIAAAGLDVTEPEPLPDDHPLWHLPNVLITPHVANPQQNMEPNFAAFAAANIQRITRGEAPQGLIDLTRKY